MPQQFENPANVEVHRRTTAQEILRDFARHAARRAHHRRRHRRPHHRLRRGAEAGMAEPQGLRGRADAVAGPLRRRSRARTRSRASAPASSRRSWTPSLLDGVIQVEPSDAKEMARRAAREEGMLVGISSGATLAGDRAEAAGARRPAARARLQLRHRRALSVGARLPSRRRLKAPLTAFLCRAVNSRSVKTRAAGAQAPPTGAASGETECAGRGSPRPSKSNDDPRAGVDQRRADVRHQRVPRAATKKRSARVAPYRRCSMRRCLLGLTHLLIAAAYVLLSTQPAITALDATIP